MNTGAIKTTRGIVNFHAGVPQLQVKRVDAATFGRQGLRCIQRLAMEAGVDEHKALVGVGRPSMAIGEGVRDRQGGGPGHQHVGQDSASVPCPGIGDLHAGILQSHVLGKDASTIHPGIDLSVTMVDPSQRNTPREDTAMAPPRVALEETTCTELF